MSLVLPRLRDAQALYGAQNRYAGVDRALQEAAWRLEYKSRRYHELYTTKRGKHQHKGAWEDCRTLSCEQDRDFLYGLVKAVRGVA